MVLRVHGDEIVFSSSLHQVPPRIPQMNMMKVHIPFTFKLLETSKSSYSGKQLFLYFCVFSCIFIRESRQKLRLKLERIRSVTFLKQSFERKLFLMEITIRPCENCIQDVNI